MKNLSQYVWKHVENLIWKMFETFLMESHEEFEGRESLEQSGWNPVENSPAWEQWSGRSKPVSMYPPLLLSKQANSWKQTTWVMTVAKIAIKSLRLNLMNGWLRQELLTLCCSTIGLQCSVQIFAFSLLLLLQLKATPTTFETRCNSRSNQIGQIFVKFEEFYI